MSMKQPAIYITTNKENRTLYIGVTSDLQARIIEHKEHVHNGFSDKYNTDKLVYFELLHTMESAIKREKQLKNWHRDWKINLIEKENPTWNDLFLSLTAT